MRTHSSLTKPATKCYHGVSINKPCKQCIEYFIRTKQTEIRILKRNLADIKKGEKKK